MLWYFALNLQQNLFWILLVHWEDKLWNLTREERYINNWLWFYFSKYVLWTCSLGITLDPLEMENLSTNETYWNNLHFNQVLGDLCAHYIWEALDYSTLSRIIIVSLLLNWLHIWCSSDSSTGHKRMGQEELMSIEYWSRNTNISRVILLFSFPTGWFSIIIRLMVAGVTDSSKPQITIIAV